MKSSPARVKPHWTIKIEPKEMCSMKKFVIALATGKVEVADTVKEAVEILGKKAGISTTQRAVLKGDVPTCQQVEEEEVPAILAAVGQAPEDTVVAEDKAPEDTNPPEDTEDDKAPEDTNPPTPPISDNGPEYPEVGHFKDEKAFKKFTKAMKNNDHVFEWCELEGITWKRCPEQPPIDRMRAIVALKAKHFPETAPKASTKSKSAYADYTTDKLVEMALENDILVEGDAGDMRILRMKTIMALRNAGIIA
jgi:hypothetical protein